MEWLERKFAGVLSSIKAHKSVDVFLALTLEGADGLNRQPHYWF